MTSLYKTKQYIFTLLTTLLTLFIILSGSCFAKNFNSNSKRTENVTVRIAIFADVTSISRQSEVLDEFLKGFLESFGKAGFDIQHNMIVENFIIPDIETFKDENIIKELRKGKFNLILCLGNRQAEYLVRKGISSGRIISLDEDRSTGFSFHGNKSICVSHALSVSRKFAIYHSLFPNLKKVFYLTDGSSNNNIQRIRELERLRYGLHLNEIIPLAVNDMDKLIGLLDRSETKNAIVFLSGDSLVGCKTKQLANYFSPKGIPVVAENQSAIDAGALLAVNADIGQIGRETGELAIEIVLGINSSAKHQLYPHSENLILNSQYYFENAEEKVNIIQTDSFKFTKDSISEKIKEIIRRSRDLFGKHILVKGKFVSYENENWLVKADNISLFRIVNEINSILPLTGQQGKIEILGDYSRPIKFEIREKNLKELIDRMMIHVGGICNVNNLLDYVCHLPTRENEDAQEQIIWVYRPHGSEPAVLKTKIEQQNFQVSIDKSEESNVLIFKGKLSSLTVLRDYLMTIDIPPPEVLIELLVVEFIHGDGFSWGIDIGNGQKNNLSKAIIAPGSLNPLSLTFNVKDSLGLSFNANIKALSERNEARIVTNPHLATKNGRAAELSSKEQRYVKLESYDYQSDRRTFMLQQVDAGVELKITPIIMSGNNIDLKLDGTLSVFEVPTDETNAAHIVNTTKIESAISVRDGATLVIGGLIKSENIKSRNRTPLLGSIPLLGLLFTRTYTVKNVTETVLYITPHVYPIENYETISSWGELERIINSINRDISQSIRALNRQ